MRRDVITEVIVDYGDFVENDICQIKNIEEFGYRTITVERPLRDENGTLILKKGKQQADKSLKDTENVPLTESVEEYFEREVKPFAPDAWIDTKKTVVGYEIPFTRYFYKYQQPEKSEVLAQRFVELEASVSARIANLFKGV